MAARSLGRIARLKPAVSHRCTVPAVGRIGGVGSSHRDSREDDRNVRALLSQTRDIHVTRRSDSTVLLAGAGVAVSALIARYGLEEYKKYQATQTGAKKGAEAEAPASNPSADGNTDKAPPRDAGAAAAASSSGGLFGAFGKRFYEGGFEEKMTRKEAALILGVRERAPAQRIKDAHRRILMINHPDKGGSKYMAAKINEAKEILLKGRK